MFRDWPDFPAVQGLAFGEGGLAQVAGPGVGRVPALPELDRTPDDTANWFWGPEAPGPSGSALCGWAGCFLTRGTHVLETVCHTRFPWDQRDGPLPQGRCLLARARRWPVVWGEGTLGCGPRQPSASGDLSLVCEKEGQPWGTELAVTGVFVVSATGPIQRYFCVFHFTVPPGWAPSNVSSGSKRKCFVTRYLWEILGFRKRAGLPSSLLRPLGAWKAAVKTPQAVCPSIQAPFPVGGEGITAV